MPAFERTMRPSRLAPRSLPFRKPRPVLSVLARGHGRSGRDCPAEARRPRCHGVRTNAASFRDGSEEPSFQVAPPRRSRPCPKAWTFPARLPARSPEAPLPYGRACASIFPYGFRRARPSVFPRPDGLERVRGRVRSQRELPIRAHWPKPLRNRAARGRRGPGPAPVVPVCARRRGRSRQAYMRGATSPWSPKAPRVGPSPKGRPASLPVRTHGRYRRN